MEIGISIFRGIDYKKQVQCMKKVGVTRTMMASEYPDFDNVIKYILDNGMICENLHAPFDKINDMWHEGDAGKAMLNRLYDCVDKCEKYNIPAMVLHVSSGRPMAPITKIGEERYEKLLNYAEEKDITVAFENLRYFENLNHLMNMFPKAKFCWDNGHQKCRLPEVKYLSYFGNRLSELHIHDNRCEQDTDDHRLPFDGNIDFNEVARELAECDFKGTLMLEIEITAKIDGVRSYAEIYSDEEYYEKAAEVARKIADMVEEERKKI